MREETKTVYIANDESSHETRKDCKLYEKVLSKKEKIIKKITKFLKNDEDGEGYYVDDLLLESRFIDLK